MSLSGHVQLFDNDIHDTTSTKKHPIGTIGVTVDGKKYRYTENGGTALAAGKLCVAATQVANHENIAVASAASVDATEVTVTLGATAVSENDYAGGYMVVNDAAGEGIAYRVSGHAAADASASLTVKLHEPLKVALTTSSEVTLVKNPWKDVVISAVDQADMPVGVPNVAIAANEYGWLQTGGVCSVLADEAITAGLQVTTGTSVAGAVEAVDAVGEPNVGVAIQAAVDTEYRAVYLQID